MTAKSMGMYIGLKAHISNDLAVVEHGTPCVFYAATHQT